MKYEVWKAPNKEWRFHFVARNGEIVFSSEGYETKQGALKGVSIAKRSFFAKVVVINSVEVD